MSILTNRKTRRQFLVGSGQTLLALPLLPSLLSSEAFAQALAVQKRLMIVDIAHNTLDRFWPDRKLATTPVGADGCLEFIINSKFASSSAISPLLSNGVYESLRSNGQLTMLRGLVASTRYQGHGLQNIGHNSDGSNSYAADPLTPTFDTVIENSPTIYPASTSSYITKSIRINSGGVKRVGTTLQDQGSFFNGTPSAMFKTVFSSLTAGTTAPADLTNALKTNILNRVYNSYTSLKSNRRISADDKARVDEHLGFISDIQKKLATANSGFQMTCSTPAAPTDPVYYKDRMPIYLNLLSLAFKCGLTKLGTAGFTGDTPWNGGGFPGITNSDFHGGVLHRNEAGMTVENSYNIYGVWMKWNLDLLANNFLAPLNVEEGATGRTYLDNMLTAVLTEGGSASDNDGFGHINGNYQPILIGSMAGAVRTNRYYHLPHKNEGSWSRSDIPYNTLPITLMQLMGVPPSEFQAYSSGGLGYGKYETGGDFVARQYKAISEILT